MSRLAYSFWSRVQRPHFVFLILVLPFYSAAQSRGFGFLRVRADTEWVTASVFKRECARLRGALPVSNATEPGFGESVRSAREGEAPWQGVRDSRAVSPADAGLSH